MSKGPRKPVPPRDTLQNCRELARQLDGGLITPVEAIKALQWQVWTCQHAAGEARGIVICTNCGSKLSKSILPAATSVNPNHPTT